MQDGHQLPKDLDNLYRSGKLDKALHALAKIPHIEHIGTGKQAIAYLDKESGLVYKLIPKTIRYFKTFTHDTPYDLKKKVKILRLFFLRIKSIKYNDKWSFIYVQKYGESIINNDEYFIVSMLQFVLAMLIYNIIVEDISDHNIAYHNGNIVSFDFHGMYSIKMDEDRQILNPLWGERLLRKISYYTNLIGYDYNKMKYCFDTVSHYEAIDRLRAVYKEFYDKYYEKFNDLQKEHITKKDIFLSKIVGDSCPHNPLA